MARHIGASTLHRSFRHRRRRSCLQARIDGGNISRADALLDQGAWAPPRAILRSAAHRSMINIALRVREWKERRTVRAVLGAMPAIATSKDYRERVELIAALAGKTSFPQIRNELLQIAVEFERLAAQAESREDEPERLSDR